jgi:hypothetical protein
VGKNRKAVGICDPDGLGGNFDVRLRRRHPEVSGGALGSGSAGLGEPCIERHIAPLVADAETRARARIDGHRGHLNCVHRAVHWFRVLPRTSIGAWLALIVSKAIMFVGGVQPIYSENRIQPESGCVPAGVPDGIQWVSGGAGAATASGFGAIGTKIFSL